MARRRLNRKGYTFLLLLAVIIVGIVLLCRRCSSGEVEKPDATPSGPVNKIPVDAALAHRLDSFVNNYSQRNVAEGMDSVGVCVYDLTAEKVVFANNADKILNPASSMKMLTTLAALKRWGDKYTFDSSVLTKGEMKGDSLVGDIAFKFTYDPAFNVDSLTTLITALQNKGIHAVKGKIIVDLAFTDPMAMEPHWVPGDLKVARLGLLYKGQKRILSDIRYLLAQHGFKGNPEVVVGKAPEDAKVVATTSTPLLNVVAECLQHSSNINAECLEYAMSEGYAKGNDYRKGGIEYLKKFVNDTMKCTPGGVTNIHDCCGLCRYDGITARFLCQLLECIYKDKALYDDYMRLLPVSGQSGTLARRMHKQSVVGTIHAKTGTLTVDGGMTSLVGYVTGSNGHQLAFAVILNHLPVADARVFEDRFCEQVVK